MHKRSAAARLASLEPGQRAYIETTLPRYQSDMRVAIVPRSRRSAALAGREFEASLVTGVGTRIGDIRYLICIERTQ